MEGLKECFNKNHFSFLNELLAQADAVVNEELEITEVVKDTPETAKPSTSAVSKQISAECKSTNNAFKGKCSSKSEEGKVKCKEEKLSKEEKAIKEEAKKDEDIGALVWHFFFFFVNFTFVLLFNI